MAAMTATTIKTTTTDMIVMTDTQDRRIMGAISAIAVLREKQSTKVYLGRKSGRRGEAPL